MVEIHSYYAKLFPLYPVTVYLREANIRIASRRIYVDFPYAYWQFIYKVIPVLLNSKSPKEEFRKQWECFVSDEKAKENITFNNKLLGKVSLVATPSSDKLLLKLKVNWHVFFDYLDEKAQRLISEVEKDGSSIREVYNEIMANYYGIVSPRDTSDLTLSGMSRFDPYALEGFKKLLRKCKEEENIQYLLNILLQTVEEIEKKLKPRSRKRSRKSNSLELWCLQLKSDIYGIKECLKNVDILSCYFYLRNFLENFIKFVVYNDIARNFERNYNKILRILFFHEKIAQKKCYSIKSLKKDYGKELSAALQAISPDDVNWEEKVFQEIARRQCPKLCIGRTGKGSTFKEFRDSYNVDLFEKYWSACSEIIHNQSPLPFFSLLEVKAYKHFLKKYVECFISNLTRIFGISKELIEGKQTLELSEEKIMLTTRAKKILHKLSLEKEREVKSIISSIVSDKNLLKETSFNPLTLLSLFHLSSPGWTQIYSGEFNKEDMEYLIEKIESISLDKGIKYRWDSMFQVFQEKMMPKLQQVSEEFSKLNDEEKKAVIFSLLAIMLPQVMKENTFL
jgi:hypothetical protein